MTHHRHLVLILAIALAAVAPHYVCAREVKTDLRAEATAATIPGGGSTPTPRSRPPTDVTTERVAATAKRAVSYLANGRAREAIAVLEQAREQAAVISGPAARSLALVAVSDGYLLVRRLDEALDVAEDAVRLARQAGGASVLAAALNQLGNVSHTRASPGEALGRYREALALAGQASDMVLAAKVRENAIRALIALERESDAAALLDPALDAARRLAQAKDRLRSLIALGHLAQRLAGSVLAQRAELTAAAHAALNEAFALAETTRDVRGKSYAAGHLGELYLAARRFEDAAFLLQQALFFAEERAAPELVVRWQREIGRLRVAQGAMDEAEVAYSHALDELKAIQPALVFGERGSPRLFRESVGEIYLEFAELLLRRARSGVPTLERQAALRHVRRVMEDFKAVELENHFRDDCVAAQRELNRTLEIDHLLAPGTATLYPVVFADRTELLLSLADGTIMAFGTVVEAGELARTAIEFREAMDPGSNPRRLRNASRRLYDWLIAPIEATLHGARVETLVIVPDDVLRTVPFAALHDGEKYLLERYTLAVSPGLALTARSEPRVAQAPALLAGLTDAVQGFDALPHVAEEIDRVASIVGGKQLVDRQFSKRSLIDELNRTPFGIIAFATHGEVRGDPTQSFVLTHDDRLSFDELERFIRISEFRDQPVDLLVLSACDTAIGDERAALGLAGVALKAGARSAMASLWSVNDRSTAQLVPAFFKNLSRPAVSKARALQLAQRQLLADPDFAHPYYWAPFILIGNWQ